MFFLWESAREMRTLDALALNFVAVLLARKAGPSLRSFAKAQSRNAQDDKIHAVLVAMRTNVGRDIARNLPCA
jgi:hypothetical protein